MPPQSEPHVQESMSIKGESISKVNKRPDSEGFRNTSNLKIVFFDQQSYNAPSVMPYCEVHKGEKEQNIPKTTDMASASLRTYARLDKKPKEEYGLFDKLQLSLIGEREVA